MEKVKAYTDGAAILNPGPGGYSFLVTPADDISPNDKTVFFSGGSLHATNQQMELSAVLECLRYLREHDYNNILIYSDSRYCVDGCNVWTHNWARNGWRKKRTEYGGGAQVKNLDLWKPIYNLYCELKVKLIWVKGHSGEPLNEFCDNLANEAANSFAIQRHAKFNQIGVGDFVARTLPDTYYVPRYIVNQKFETNATIILKLLNGQSKDKIKPLVLSSKEFDEIRFIRL